MKRREFIENITGVKNKKLSINTTISLNSPSLSSSSEFNESENILVVIQLIGGNDDLNTLIPLDMYDLLMNHRSNIMIKENKILKITDKNGFHPKFKEIYKLFNEGYVSCIQNVGYFNQNRSHFRSMDIWNSGSDANQMLSSGWLGRYLDIFHSNYPNDYPTSKFPDPLCITMGNIVADTCQGNHGNFAYALNHANPVEYLEEHPINNIIDNVNISSKLKFYDEVIKLTNKYSKSILQAQAKGKNLALYPEKIELAQQLKVVAKLISGGLKTKIYTLTLGGFDTHAYQTIEDTSEGWHATVLEMLSKAVNAFQEDLIKMGLQNKVLTMTYSEFGRQIKSNASMGTDHGSAGFMYFFGDKFYNQIIGGNPEILEKVENQAGLKELIDFRDVYSTVLVKWLNLDKNYISQIFKRNNNIIKDFI